MNFPKQASSKCEIDATTTFVKLICIRDCLAFEPQSAIRPAHSFPADAISLLTARELPYCSRNCNNILLPMQFTALLD